MNCYRYLITVFLLILAGVCGCGAGESGAEDRIFDDKAMEFFSRLDVDEMKMLAAQFGGRPAGALSSVASAEIAHITGSENPEGVPAVVAYFELYFNTGQYFNKPLVFVKSKKLRPLIADTLVGGDLKAFHRTNRIPPAAFIYAPGQTAMQMLRQEPVMMHMVRARRITMEDAKAFKPAGTLTEVWGQWYQQQALRVPLDRFSSRYGSLVGMDMRLLPGGQRVWASMNDVLVPPQGHQHSENCEIVFDLRKAWKDRDAEGVNSIVAKIRKTGSQDPAYPSDARLGLELMYNDIRKGHPAFIGFVSAFVLFVISTASGRKWARNWAMVIMTVTTLFITGAYVLRWIASGEAWYLPPMMTQYEALLSSVVLAAILAVIIELFRKYDYIGLSAAFYGAAVLVWFYFGNSILGPDTVRDSIGVVKGILKHWLMILHVSVIVVGHALAGMTLVTSWAYIGLACFKGLDRKSASSSPGLFGPTGDSSMAIVDRCNLILAQVGCWTLIVGTLLGAWWADDAWARWWGWDAKETWALITCLLFVAVLHVRLVASTKYRGLITAVGCILGGLAMLFNWFIVNTVLQGLHSYG